MGINPKSFTTLKQIKLTKNNVGDVSTSHSANDGGDNKNKISNYAELYRLNLIDEFECILSTQKKNRA